MRELSSIKGFGPKRLEALAKRGIETARDLVETLPTGYVVCSQIIIAAFFPCATFDS